MKKRNITLILILLILTGCDIEYNLNIDRQLNFKENIILNVTSQEDKSKLEEFNLHIPIIETADDLKVYQEKIKDIEYYDSIKKDDKLEFNYNFSKDKYIESTFVNNAYEYISITELENELIISTSKEFLLFNNYENLDNVKVKLTSKYQLIDTNADEINRHEYIWHIDKNNAYGKNIYLKLDTSKEDLTFWEKLLEGEYTNIFTVSLLLLLIGFIIYYILKRKSIKRDEI